MTDFAATVIICTYDRYDLLPKAVASLTRQAFPASKFEIIIVDNSPDAGRSSEISEDYAGLSNLTWAIERKPGLSNARNVGIEMARGEIVAFIDDDAIADSGWLDAMVGAFARFPAQAVAAGGRVIPIWEQPRPQWLHDRLLGYVSVVDWGGELRYAKPHEWVAGTNLAFRRHAVRDAGGFSVHLGRNRGGQALLSNDETDLIERLGSAGGRLLYVPEAIVEHLVPRERLTQAWFRRRVTWQAISAYLQDPQDMFQRAPGHWNGVTEFFSRLPPRLRTPRGFWAEQSDPEMFEGQMAALYNFTIASLAGFHGLEGD